MAITLDSSTTGVQISDNVTYGPTTTFAYNNQGNCVIVSVNVNTSSGLSALTYDKVACTFNGAAATGFQYDIQAKVGPGTATYGSLIFYWLNPPTGSKNVYVKITNGYATDMCVAVQSFNNVSALHTLLKRDSSIPLNLYCQLYTPSQADTVVSTTVNYWAHAPAGQKPCDNTFTNTENGRGGYAWMDYKITASTSQLTVGYKYNPAWQNYWVGVALIGLTTKIKAIDGIDYSANVAKVYDIPKSSISKVMDIQ